MEELYLKTNYLKKLLSSNQSGFRPKDSCGNQLLPTVYSILGFPNCVRGGENPSTVGWKDGE